MKEFLISGNIDWQELKKQKKSLLSAINIFETKDMRTVARDLEGILNLIDNVQYNAIKSGMVGELEIFGKYNEETGEYENENY